MKYKRLIKKRGRGRPKGSKNKNSVHTDIHKRVGLTCSKCKRYMEVRTSNIEIYTDERKKNWICPICK